MKYKTGIKFKMLVGMMILTFGLITSSYLNVSRLYEFRDLISNNSQNITDFTSLTDQLIQSNLVVSILICFSGFFVVLFLANTLVKSINTIYIVIQKLAIGQIPEIENKYLTSNDEIAEMQKALNRFIEGLKQTAQFAVKIGKGELDAKFNPLSNEDMLGHALLNMRNNLQEVFSKDDDRNKIIVCNAEIGNILRSHSQLEPMGNDLLIYLCNKINSLQGAFYIVEENTDGFPVICLSNTYAYNKKKSIKKQFRFGEGLVGQSAIEMDIVHRTEIPREYVSITSGLIGEKRPESILIVPLITNEKIYGLVEFASIYKFTELQIEIVKNVSEIIAQTIFNLQINEKTSKLLAESQRMSSELKEQSIALQQNAEEMQATQEELQRSNTKLNEQIEEVNRSQKRTHVLLENSSEIITICDQKGNINYISPSVTSILGYKPEDLIGTNDIERIKGQGKIEYDNMFDSLIQNPEIKITLEVAYLKQNSETIYLEISGKNLIKDPAIQGIVLNTRDITEKKVAERESRMRSQMQSLSENSPDLITRLNKDGKIYYINPTIEQLTQQKPDQFLQKTIFETGLNDSVVNSWQNLIHEVIEKKDKLQVEMPFPTENGSLVMSVNAIPEFNETKEIESILLVSNDITERKKTELEIQSKNKKITESINYAQRIQVAILPDQQRIKSLFPQSFMLYIPRDVVSGDFPWFVESGEDIFIAVVDCTGHGVPGAMLSLIGYFLLNDIVKSQKVTTPGKILDLLDNGVTKTLKQDMAGNEMKDGMDICLCKINLKTNKLEYAGAHRPLYQLRKGEILEYKGDKFPVGGGIFKNQTNFTNHVVNIEKGDAFFFCSDGYPDQFGGVDNKKIGPSKIKSLILENSDNPDFNSIYDTFNDFFLHWKGKTKQLDDVLMIGLKF
jgi:PAS domain S-box-containing protein